MKLTARIKRKIAGSGARSPFVPVGYFANRPALLAEIFEAGIGRIESIRIVRTPPRT